MPDSTKRAWTKPAVTKFPSIDALRGHLEAKATSEDIPAIETMIGRLRSQQGVGSADCHRPKTHIVERRG